MMVYLKETELILLHRQRRTIDAENSCKGIMTKHKKLKRHKTKARTFLMFHTYLEKQGLYILLVCFHDARQIRAPE